MLRLLALALSAQLLRTAGGSEYSAVSDHTFGDPESCASAHCDDIGGWITANKKCGADAGTAAKCATEGAASCDSDPLCFGFVVPVVGKAGKNMGWAKWHNAGIGNMVPNGDWTAYWKVDFPCASCAGGGLPLPNAPVKSQFEGAESAYTHHCPLTVSGQGTPNTKIYCRTAAEEESDQGEDFDLLLLLGGACYVGVGVLVGSRVGRGSGLRAHPHHGYWVQAKGLCEDGVALVRGGGGRSPGRGRESLLPTSQKKSKQGGSGSSKKNGGKHKKSGKGGKSSRGSSGEGSAQATATSLSAAEDEVKVAVAEREWAPTRTGHLSRGGRETGVKVNL